MMKKIHKVLSARGTKPWIHWVRDGLNATNIKMLHVSEIEPISKYLEKNFMGGFKFSYLNYVKDKTDNLLDERGEFAQCSGYSIDNTVN
jgi:hypothetical protein